MAPKTEQKKIEEAVKEAEAASDAEQKEASGKAIQDAVIAREDIQKATEEAEITGADIPERAVKEIKGVQTAGNHPETAQSAGKPIGAQAEPALRSKTGGSLPHGHVATGAGLVPASAFGAAAPEAMARHAANVRRDVAREKVQDEVIEKMTKPELRAVAHTRGYKIGEGGTRTLQRKFREAQDADTSLRKAEAAEAAEGVEKIPAAASDEWDK